MKSFFSGVLGAAAFAAASLTSTASFAHFLLVYTPEVNIQKKADLPFEIVFWHPFENGHVMDMEQPLEFYYVNKGKKTDLMSSLKPMEFTGLSNKAAAFEAVVPVKRNGDYIFVMKPAPYYEESEDIYIQQITKSFVNKGDLPTDWSEPVGLETEIIPLNKPTNIIAGSTFSGRVVADGKPVAGVEIEIEYMAAEPDVEKNAPKAATASPMPGGAVVAITDENGLFTFGVPKAGFWGFAALGSGPKTEHDGKELSQDAVLWVRAYDMK